MKIRVDVNVLAGNMGDGWADQHDAAVGYGEFLKPRIEADCLSAYPDADVIVTIEVGRESGCSRETSVTIDGMDDPDNEYDAVRKLEETISDTENQAWDDFCCSPEAEQYFN